MKNITKVILLTQITLLLAFNAAGLSWGEGIKVTETVVADFAENKMHEGIFFASPDLNKVTFSCAKYGGVVVVVNEWESPAYLDVHTIRFLRDSSGVAFAAQKEEGWCVNYDGTEGAFYDEIVRRSIILGPTKGDCTYVARRGDKMIVVHNGKEEPGYDKINSIASSSETGAYAYSYTNLNSPPVKMGGIVFNGVEMKEFTLATSLNLSPDGNLAFYAKKDGVNNKFWYLVSNGKEVYVTLSACSSPLFNPSNGRKLSFWGKISAIETDNPKYCDKMFVHYEGRLLKYFDSIYSMEYSPDGSKFIFAGFEGGEGHVYVNSKPMYKYNGDTSMRIAVGPKGKKLAWISDSMSVVVNGKEERKYEKVSYPQYSENGTLGYMASFEPGRFFAVVGKHKGKSVETSETGRIFFGPKGKSYGVFLKSGRKAHVMFNDELSPEFEVVLLAQPYDTGRRLVNVNLATVASDWEIHLNRYKSGEIAPIQFIFDSPDSLHFLGVRENKIYRVEMKGKL